MIRIRPGRISPKMSWPTSTSEHDGDLWVVGPFSLLFRPPNVGLCCKPRKQAEWQNDTLRSVGACQNQPLVMHHLQCFLRDHDFEPLSTTRRSSVASVVGAALSTNDSLAVLSQLLDLLGSLILLKNLDVVGQYDARVGVATGHAAVSPYRDGDSSRP